VDPAEAWRIRSSELDLADGVLVGVLNVTPDSFSDGGFYADPDSAISHGLRLAAEGAHLVDVGGESTRPGAGEVPAAEELGRVLPVVEGLAAAGVTVSIDTSKPEVAEAALAVGAEVVNDVRAFRAPGMTELAAETGCGVVILHMLGEPHDMQQDPRYDDVVAEVEGFLLKRARVLQQAGVDPARIAIDPGIGFGKTLEHNLALLASVARFASHGYPVMLGTSRKTFLGILTGLEGASERDLPTAVTTALGFVAGARVFRVHDIPSSRHALALASAIVRAQ
jgi:dihydropteroate synthase